MPTNHGGLNLIYLTCTSINVTTMRTTQLPRIAVLSLTYALLTSAEPATAGTSLETRIGQKNTVFDLKAGTSLSSSVGLFTRNRIGIGYKPAVTYFGLIDLTYALPQNFNLVVELQVDESSWMSSRAGLEYTHMFGLQKAGVLSTYGLVTLGTDYLQVSTINAQLVGKVQYTVPFNSPVQFTSSIEAITDLYLVDHRQSVQRLRCGILYEKNQAGIALDLKETHTTTEVVPGVYVKREF